MRKEWPARLQTDTIPGPSAILCTAILETVAVEDQAGLRHRRVSNARQRVLRQMLFEPA